MGYALTGVVVAAVLATSPRSQRIWLWTAAGVHAILLLALTLAIAVAGSTGHRERADAVSLYTEGTWFDQVWQRVESLPLYRAEAVFILPLSVAPFLVGAWMVRAGLFEEGGRTLRRRMMKMGSASRCRSTWRSAVSGAGRGWSSPAMARLHVWRSGCSARSRACRRPGGLRVSCSAGWPRWAAPRSPVACSRTFPAASCAMAGDWAWRPRWARPARGGPSRSTRRYARS
jgi:hypothetical protein